MNFISSVQTALVGRFSGLTKDQLRRDLLAGLNVATMALPLSMAFAIASGVNPERGLFTAIIGGAIVAALGGSRVQIGGPTGAFVIITFSVMSQYGLSGLLLCTMLAGAMLVIMGAARLGSIIRFMPYPVSRAFTKGIAVLILSTQIKFFFGLQAEMPAGFVGKLQVFYANMGAIHWPTVTLG
ncbi:MAG TPA: SulP family inorganic anion transporter, partial [Opitutaceae bacterium]|nr:SulP family inorganic anion transporter [Opitutaceae bacterium]